MYIDLLPLNVQPRAFTRVPCQNPSTVRQHLHRLRIDNEGRVGAVISTRETPGVYILYLDIDAAAKDDVVRGVTVHG